MRAFPLALLLLCGCGSVCNRIVAADEAATKKGEACGATSNKYNATICNQNLNKCSPDDVKWLNTYADCIEKLPVCQNGQAFSWGVQRFACAESLGKVSGTCVLAIQ